MPQEQSCAQLARASSGLKLDPSMMLFGSAVVVSPSLKPGLITPRLASLIKSTGTSRSP
ncbi:MAG: hypothetical protein ACRD42_00370 [Nitrososphaeraceae archaeon]